MLATHLSFREIGLRFYLSRNTVKTQAISVYRKLGASNRSEAVERAHTLGLIEPRPETRRASSSRDDAAAARRSSPIGVVRRPDAGMGAHAAERGTVT